MRTSSVLILPAICISTILSGCNGAPGGNATFAGNATFVPCSLIDNPAKGEPGD